MRMMEYFLCNKSLSHGSLIFLVNLDEKTLSQKMKKKTFGPQLPKTLYSNPSILKQASLALVLSSNDFQLTFAFEL